MFRLSQLVPCGCTIVVMVTCCLQLGLHAAGPQASAASPTSLDARALLDQYCVTCHNERLQTAGLLLDKIDDLHVGADGATREKVVRKLRSGAMPQAGRRRPDEQVVRLPCI